jgi:catechol 2,3-dioxygenase-like lactoylglutathione lyase family enzyme
MIDHISIPVRDVPANTAFYTAVLAPLGGKEIMRGGPAVGFGTATPEFWLEPAREGAGVQEKHLAFSAANRAAVTAFFDAAVAAGAQVLHEPRLWPEYHPNYFGAFVRDPDGNNVEAVCHLPE